MTEATRPRIELTPSAVKLGYRQCRQNVRKYFRDQSWVMGNFPNENRKSIDAMMWHFLQCVDLLDLESPNRLPLDVWSDVRSDLSDAFLDQCTREELAALVDTFRKYDIPKQFLFDMLDGADFWIRNRKFDTFEELKVFAYRLGGAPMTAAVPILGFVKPDFEVPAIRCGQAIFLTQALAQCVDNLKQNKLFLAAEDMDICKVAPHRLKLRQGGTPWNNLVHMYCSRIEDLFCEGARLIDYMDFDGVRTIKSLISLHWKMLLNMKLDPGCALSEEGVISKRELFRLKSRHIMGLEGNIPIFRNSDSPCKHH